jgi:hypothetical protein
MSKRKIFLIVGVVVLVVLIGFSTVFVSVKGVPALSLDENNLPKFIKANYINLDDVGYVSQFRSNNGHDFSDATSPCSSMKHYFDFPEDRMLRIGGVKDIPPTPTVATGEPIYSPVDGTIVGISSENFPLGKQFSIRVASDPQFTVRIFHTYPLDGVAVGKTVKAGEQIGIITKGQGSDIAVEANALTGRTFYSIFEVMSDDLFAQYKAHGATSRDQFILSADYRKQHPLKCEGEQFVDGDQGGRKEWVKLAAK